MYGYEVEADSKENLLVSSLCSLTFENNPNFTNWAYSHNLRFMPHAEFKKKLSAVDHLVYP